LRCENSHEKIEPGNKTAVHVKVQPAARSFAAREEFEEQVELNKKTRNSR
jgi:hypothetical protein